MMMTETEHTNSPVLEPSAPLLEMETSNSKRKFKEMVHIYNSNNNCNNKTFIGAINCSSLLGRDEDLAKVEMATLVVMFIVTVLGNSAVLAALLAKRYLMPRTKIPRLYYFMLHLCIADMCTAWLNILPQLAWEVTYRFRGGDCLCKIVKFCQTLGPYLSSYVLTATALDRYQAICNPLTYCSWSSKRGKCMIIGAWILAIVFCTPQAIIFRYHKVADGIYDCWAVFEHSHGERIYVTWYSISVFVVPLVTLIYTYTCICLTIWRNSGPLSASVPHKVVSRAKINTIKQTVAVIFLYICCSLPFISAQLWATWDPHASSSPFFAGPTFTILTLLSSLNSCVNPWIYLLSNSDLTEALWELMKCTWRRDRQDILGSGGSTGKGNQNCHLAGQHTHFAKWVVSVPPNLSENADGRTSGKGQDSRRRGDSSESVASGSATVNGIIEYHSIPGEQAHGRKWVVSLPPNNSASERSVLRLFRAPHRDVWTSVDNRYETSDSKLSPEL